MAESLLRRPLELLENNLRRPSGFVGGLVGHLMTVQHRTLTEWAIGHMAIQPDDHVLDIGCGGGMAIKLLAAKASHGFVAGVDYSPEMVTQASARNSAAVVRGRVQVKHGNAMKLPFGDETFDVVSAIETFYFWPDCMQGLAEARRVLRPGGRVVVTLEMSREGAGDPTLLQKYFGQRFTERSERAGLHIFSGIELIAMLTKAGFQDARFVAEPSKSLGWLCALATKPGNTASTATTAKANGQRRAAQAALPDRPAPEAPGLPVLGNILDFKRDILRTLRFGWETHGDLVRHRLGPVIVHGVSSPELAGEVLTNSAVFGKLGPDNPLRLVLGDGLLTSSDHESWMRNRRMMQPIYTKQSISSMYDTMVASVEEMLGQLRSERRSGDVIDLHKVMMRVTLDIVGRCMFSTHVRETIGAISPDAMDIAINYAFSRLQNPLSPPLSWPTPANRRFRKVMEGLDELMFRLVRERRQSGGHRQDLLDMLLSMRDADTGVGMTDKELRDEIITTFAAGHETTAITLTWALYLLSRHPRVLRRLEAEVDQVLGERLPTLEDMRQMPYSLQVFEESMRLYPSAPIVPRLTTTDTSLGGYRVPAGSRVLVNLFNIGRHLRHWPDPERFDPDRFSAEARRHHHRYAYIPFGAGPHLCIGKHFALMEAQLLLIALVQRYEFRHVPTHRVVDVASITLRPRYGMLMTMHERRPDVVGPSSTAHLEKEA
jgi:cytochrome P450/ubiquinone/menaquinone biosynthesis C-methylase UbiE